MTTMMHRTSQIDDAMEAMRTGRGRGGRTAGHEGHRGCGRKQHGLKERRMWAGSKVGGDSSAGRQRAPVSATHEFPEASSPTRQARTAASPSQVLRSVASLFFSSRGGEAANVREKEQAVEECKQKVSGDWKSETEDRAYCFGYEWLEILWLDVLRAVGPFQDRNIKTKWDFIGCTSDGHPKENKAVTALHQL